MQHLTTFLILTIFSLSALTLPTTTPTNPFTISTLPSPSLEKRALPLPNGWEFILKSRPGLIEPLEMSIPVLSSLYTAAIDHASQVPAPLSVDAVFQGGFIALAFHGQEDDRPLDMKTIVEFCTRMRDGAIKGDALILAGWLMNSESGGQIYVTMGIGHKV
ncbi:MAG: hypothetical protein Q9178_007930 [Gyalolechia marmorata]